MTIERDRLQARQRKTKGDAAFSLLALEEDDGKRMSTKVDQLTDSLILAMNRLKSLQDQIEFMSRLLDETIPFRRRSASVFADRTGAGN